MRTTMRLGLLGLVAVTACVENAAPPVAPQPVPPPSAFSHPGYVYYYNGALPPPVAPSARMPPAPSVRDAMNLMYLQQAAAQPRRCHVPFEVAPGVFTHVDCYPYKRVTIAVKHATALKLNLMKSGRFKWNAFPAMSGVHGIAPFGALPGQAPYPDLVDHRLNGTEGPIKDQGDVGACTAFALSSVMDNSLRRAGQNVTTSPEHVWAHYATPTMEDAASGNLNRGVTSIEALPYSGREACELTRDPTDDCGPAYRVMPGSARMDASLEQRLAAADASNGHRIVAFEELEVSPPNIDEIVATLASGADLWAAFNVDSNAWTNRNMPNFVVPDWSAPDGGHAVAMAGYRRVKDGYQFLVHNSWGASWGDGGYAWVSQAMVQRWLHLAYKVRTDVDAGSPSAPVAPKTDEDCPGDQVLDAATNQCVGVCPDQSRPTSGICPNGPAPAPQPLPLPGFPGIPGLPGIPPIPGWFPVPAQPQTPPGPSPSPAPPSPAPNAPTNPPLFPAWPWPVPSGLPPFLPFPQ
jgi:hypothetical protein